MPISDELKEQLSKLSEEERKEVLAALGIDDKTQGDASGPSDEAYLKFAEKIAESLVEAQRSSGNVSAKVEGDEEAKKALYSFVRETDAGRDLKSVYGLGLEEMVAQKEVPAEERVAKYLKAKAEGEFAYVRQVDARIAMFFKALVERNMPVVRALTEGTDSEGGYLVPAEFRAQVVEELNNLSVMRSLATVIPMSTDTLNIPTLVAKPAVRWTGENTTIATSSAEFGQLTLTPHKLTARLPMTRELLADSAIRLVALLTRIFGEVIAEKEDKAFFVGTGSGQPKGLDQETLTTETAGSNAADSLINLQHRLKAAYRNRATWVMNNNTLRNIRKLKDTTNQYLFDRNAIQQGVPGVLLGSPVREQNDIADGKIFYGDFSFYYIGDREQLSVETTTEGANTWELDRMEIKVRERVDGKTALTRAFVEGQGF